MRGRRLTKPERAGVGAEAMDLHIALDIGVQALGERLAARLDAVFVSQAYSRLVIDCNRPGHHDLDPGGQRRRRHPGNARLSPAQAAARRGEILEPYQAAIAAELDRRAGERLLLSLQLPRPCRGSRGRGGWASCTGTTRPLPRPWHGRARSARRPARQPYDEQDHGAAACRRAGSTIWSWRSVRT